MLCADGPDAVVGRIDLEQSVQGDMYRALIAAAAEIEALKLRIERIERVCLPVTRQRDEE